MEVFINKLPLAMTEEELRAMLAEYGEIVRIKMQKDRFTGDFRGSVFVELADDELAQKAIDDLNEKVLEEGAEPVSFSQALSREGKPFVFDGRQRRPRGDFGDRPRRDFGDRPRGERSFGDRPRRDFGDKPRGGFGDRPRRDFGDKPRGERSFGDK
ncbi:MAG: hypothetical protein R3Y46_08370, partial [Opitutales bacterium]